MNKYFITITRAGGLTDLHQRELIQFFEQKFPVCVLHCEAHKTGLIHLHAVVQSPVKASCSVRKPLVKFLESIGIEVGRHTIVVKACDDGSLNYTIKEVDDDHPVSLCQGWKISDLLKKRQLALKKLSVKQAKGNDKVVCQDEAVPLILSFAQKSSVKIMGKEDFKDVIKTMVRLGFSFSRVKMASTYAEVMCRSGDDRALDDLLDMQLIGLS